MTTAVRYTPQLRLGETPLEDGTLESLLEDLDGAKAELADCKGRLEDYLAGPANLALDREYRVGRWRIKTSLRRAMSVTVPKGKR